MDRLPRTWLRVEDDIARVTFLNQVRAEIGPDHELAAPARHPVDVEARCTHCTLVAFRLADRSLALVDLDWRPRPAHARRTTPPSADHDLSVDAGAAHDIDPAPTPAPAPASAPGTGTPGPGETTEQTTAAERATAERATADSSRGGTLAGGASTNRRPSSSGRRAGGESGGAGGAHRAGGRPGGPVVHVHRSDLQGLWEMAVHSGRHVSPGPRSSHP